ncbi:MAG: Uncharacterised protein [Prochlorococcus marinus str. MIT 9313]|nr:MAG: Uncharacterised protein [Prochlorococcus marinus str. MIT 9313]
MHPTASEGIEVARQSGYKSLPFTGLHLTNLTLMQHHAADQLHIEMTHAEHPFSSLTHNSKGFWEQLIK